MIIESIAVVLAALLLDLAFGDPKNRFHPTAWSGALIARLVTLSCNASPRIERLAGICIVLAPMAIIISLLALLYAVFDLAPSDLLSMAVTVIATAILLKTTLAVRGMEKHALAVVAALENDNLASARAHLSMIVKRDTKNLDRDHIYSAVVESIGENTVDGVTGPLFYFGFFGIFGSFVYRTINTADSMVGYKNRTFKNMGWFAATSDSILNYIPSRLTGMVMILSSMLLRCNWKKSYHIMLRDGRNTESPNAGYPMAAIAGALDARLENIDHYSLGDGTGHFSRQHVTSAITLMKMTSVLFGLIVVIPAMTSLSLLGWWIHA